MGGYFVNNPYSIVRQSQFVTGRGSIRFLESLRQKRAAFFYDARVLTEARRDSLVSACENAKMECRFVTDIQREPHFSDLHQSLETIRSFEPDLLIAIGGGSVIDLAKAVHVLYEHPTLYITDLFKPFQLPASNGKAVLVAIPTTSGTGSETTCAAVLTDDESKRKHLLLDYRLIPTYAILDPELCDSLPPAVAALTGMDALAHALEASVCQASTTLIQSMAIGAALDIFMALPQSASATLTATEEDRKKARELCHYAASTSGVAINNSSAGLAHALDQMGPYFNLPHGLVCGVLLPYTTAFHSPHPIYARLSERLGYSGDDAALCQQLVSHISAFNELISIPRGFKDAGVPEAEYLENIDAFVKDLELSMAAKLSPEMPTKEEAAALLKQAYYGEEPAF